MERADIRNLIDDVGDLLEKIAIAEQNFSVTFQQQYSDILEFHKVVSDFYLLRRDLLPFYLHPGTISLISETVSRAKQHLSKLSENPGFYAMLARESLESMPQFLRVTETLRKLPIQV